MFLFRIESTTGLFVCLFRQIIFVSYSGL